MSQSSLSFEDLLFEAVRLYQESLEFEKSLQPPECAAYEDTVESSGQVDDKYNLFKFFEWAQTNDLEAELAEFCEKTECPEDLKEAFFALLRSQVGFSRLYTFWPRIRLADRPLSTPKVVGMETRLLLHLESGDTAMIACKFSGSRPYISDGAVACFVREVGQLISAQIYNSPLDKLLGDQLAATKEFQERGGIFEGGISFDPVPFS